MDAANRVYPRDVFPGLWGDLERLIEQGVIISPEEVQREIAKKDDELAAWAAKQEKLFVPFDEIQEKHLRVVVAKHELILKNSKGRNAADPFVIALACAESIAVVTQENFGSDTKPKIPDVCKAMSIECIKLVDLLKREDLSY